MNKNIQTFLACEADYEKAEVVLFGVPFDGTASFRPGTRFGPSAIRNESFGIETYSPYSDRDLVDYEIFDGGDLELPFGNTEKVLEMTQNYTEQILNDGKKFVMLGGEHLITLGAMRAVVKHYPDLHIIHLDAHTDLRTEYMGEALSHSTVMRQVWNLVGDGRIHQFGIRSGEKYEFDFAKEHTCLHKFDLTGFSEAVANLKGKPVYFSLDLDVLDPSIFCGTGTTEAGGITFKELLEAVMQLHQLNIVGCDINELSPHYDQSGSSTAVACKITREILLQMTK
ncbi:agmatinase [Anaerotignum sp. MB30-C6]|uniref:agmatinase n=1 Tax=Anaerotignum sp. MB30-C6 TaxID=3070814 RepID=UPI0027DC5264|nr:agmatinase [Anaerotignum sp. MB30-C6]WMI80198.1 agmatinase [Anaerotignum sp. MB30-C6]